MTSGPFTLIAALPARELTIRQLAMLEHLSRRDGVGRVRTMAAALGCARTVITRSTDSLSAHGLVRRERDPHDGRDVLICLTPSGAALIGQVRHALDCASQAAA